MTKLGTVAKITGTETPKKFVWGSGLNMKACKIEASQPTRCQILIDCKITIKEKVSRVGNPYTTSMLVGKDAVTLKTCFIECPMGTNAQEMAFCKSFDNYLSFMEDDEGRKIGTGFLHCESFQACTEQEAIDACIQWQGQEMARPNNGSDSVSDLMR